MTEQTSPHEPLPSLALATGRDSVITALRFALQIAEHDAYVSVPVTLPPPVDVHAPALEAVTERWIAQGRAIGESQGRAVGELYGRSQTILRQLELRFGPVPTRARYAIANASLELLERMTERVLTATYLEDVLAG
jgi:hypothetical protein